MIQTPALSSLALLAVAFAPALPAQSGGGGTPDPGQQPAPQQQPPQPGSREAMWPAPTAEDWAKPTLIKWQRSWEDAVAVSRETGKPIMVAVNMDGEIASEHYAGVRYRDPEVAKLFDPYVSVIASVYRHNPRDYDENGQRIPCSRFGHVTCGEHIAMEPIVYSMFLDETRVAPRHIGVELDGTEMYDIFYAFTVKAVLEGIEEGISARESTEKPPVEKGLEELVASRAASDREYVEQRFVQGSKAERAQLLSIAEKLGRGAPPELLRLALFGLDVETARQARRILAEQRSEAAIDLILEALSVPLPADERRMLVDALVAIGEEHPRARILASTLRGLEAEPEEGGAGRARRLARQLGEADAGKALRGRYEVESRLERLDRAASTEEVMDPLRLAWAEQERAEAVLRLAVEPENLDFRGAGGAERRRLSELRFLEALSAAESVADTEYATWRTDAVIGLASHYLGRGERVAPAITSAYAGMLEASDDGDLEVAQGWIGMAVASMRADALAEAVYAAARRREDVGGDRIAEVDAAFDLLAAHPFGTAEHALKHHDFLSYMGARQRAMDVLTRGLERFRASAALHERLRGRLLWSRGTDALLGFYAKQKDAPTADAVTHWYAGLAGLVAGEFRRRRAQGAEAVAAYDVAIADFERVIEFGDSAPEASLHYIALAKAGQAVALMELGELQRAAARVTEAFDTYQPSANALDGLNASAVSTTRMLLQRLEDAGDGTTRAALKARLDALPPELLKLPDFETPPDTPAARNRDARGRQRR